MSVKLDKRDRQLLYELELNSRQSLKELAKKLRLSKNAVAYRLKNLQEQGVIKHFVTALNVGRLGLISFRVYLKLEGATPDKEQEIIGFLKAKSIVTWVVSVEGDYTVGMVAMTKSVSEMSALWKELLEKYVNYISDRSLAIMTKVCFYSRAYLVGKKQSTYELSCITEPNPAVLDGTDIAILRLLAPNARMPVTSVAQKLGLSPRTVIARTKKLEKQGVIIGYTTALDLEKLGYAYFKLHARLHNTTRQKRAQLQEYVKTHPNMVYYDEALGGEDLEIELQVRSLAELRFVTNELRARFADIIREYKVFQYKEHKYLFMAAKLD